MTHCGSWPRGTVPVAVVMISLNEAHHLGEVLENLRGWAQEVFLVDSYSTDRTVDIALEHGINVVQRRFRGFGDQWNFALQRLPITAEWTMKIDPDERVTPALKDEIARVTVNPSADGYIVPCRLNFLGKRLPHVLHDVRLWKTGHAQFSNVDVNEHAHVLGPVGHLRGELDHLDSPDLEHWITKQNKYSSAEAIARYKQSKLAANPKLFGNALQRRMWLKRHFWKVPFRYALMYYYHLLFLGAWRAGRAGLIWSRLRTELFRTQEYKLFEIETTGKLPQAARSEPGAPDPRVEQFD
jgi:glycosyltransferase involved in cell wall biosynthesis